MSVSRKILVIVVLLASCLAIHLLSLDSGWVERKYSTGLFPGFGRTFRSAFGWSPVSFGDILYGTFVLWAGWKVIRFFHLVANFRKYSGRGMFMKIAYRMTLFFCIVYLVFNLFWGINYNRRGIAFQLGMIREKYDTNQLKNINRVLLDKVNYSKASVINNGKGYPSTKELFAYTCAAYDSLANEFPFLEYQPPSIKSSMWGWLGNYAGFTGYYNPFSGEAQVNTTVPAFLQPYIACHEVAHQLGYAKEMEANFVGFLAARSSSSPVFRYSVYLDLFLYANKNLYMTDSLAARAFRKSLLPEVENDLEEWRRFSRKHKNAVEPVIRWIYGKFLERNQQPQGILSYDEVTGFIIAYYKKYGDI